MNRCKTCYRLLYACFCGVSTKDGIRAWRAEMTTHVLSVQELKVQSGGTKETHRSPRGYKHKSSKVNGIRIK